jgi:rsbT co-antagonist protein RsbR
MDKEGKKMAHLQNPILAADLNLQAQILDQLPTPVIAVDRDLMITYMNNAGKKLINKTTEELLGKACKEVFGSLYCGTNDCCMGKAIENGSHHSARNEIIINDEKLQFESFAVPLKNELGETVGGLEFIVDISERILYEDKLREQSHAMREMSTPTIKLWEGVLILPVVGVIDSMRAQYMMETMLIKIMETYSKIIILDIQGVAAVDTAVANHLIKITKATKLMGCECILSGISPAVAQTMIELGIEMGITKTRATLSDALAEAFELLNLVVSKK